MTISHSQRYFDPPSTMTSPIPAGYSVLPLQGHSLASFGQASFRKSPSPNHRADMQ